MRIDFQDISLQNFMSYGNTPQTLSYEPGLNLIRGSVSGRNSSNGCGKTSVVSALPWCLYGALPQGTNQVDIINWKNRKDCRVETNFVKGDNKYKVVRGLKPNILEIYENGALIPSAGKKNYQDIISWDIVGLHYNTFINLVYSNLNYTTSILRMSKPQKRYFIEKLFNLEIFTKLQDSIKIKIRNIELKISENQATISRNNSQIKLLNDDTIESKTKLMELSSSKDILDEKQKQLKELSKIKLDELHFECKKLNDFKLADKRKIRSVISNFENKISDLQSSIRSLVTATSNEILEKADQYVHDNICPLCDQKVSKKSAKRKIEQEIAQNKALEKKTESYKIVIKLKLEPMLLMQHKRLQCINNAVEELVRSTERYYQDIDKTKRLSDDIKFYATLIEQEDKLKTEYVQQIERNDIRSKECNNQIDKLQKDIVRFESLKDYLYYAKEQCKDERIKQYAISAIMPYLNKYTNNYLAEIGHNFYLEIDKFMEAKIKGPGRFGNNYASLSGGEGRVVDFSFQMALHDIVRLKSANWINILFLDEILDSSVDSTNLIHLLNITELKQHKNNLAVYIISHRSEVADIEFNNVINIVKENDFSRLT